MHGRYDGEPVTLSPCGLCLSDVEVDILLLTPPDEWSFAELMEIVLLTLTFYMLTFVPPVAIQDIFTPKDIIYS